MKVAVFSTHRFEKGLLENLNLEFGFELSFFEESLNEKTAFLAKDFSVVCCYPNDRLNSAALESLNKMGIKLIALRSAGFNHVDIERAAQLGIDVVRVPAYSPFSVAEFAVTLILALNRKICRAFDRVRELNFSIEGLTGFDLNGKTVGIIGCGKIGSVLVKIMAGFGCKVLIYDKLQKPELVKDYGAKFVSLEEIYLNSDIISLHVPLNSSTHHLIDQKAFAKMKKGVLLINTGRGALIDTKALLSALKSGHIGAAGLDVYEEEEEIFSKDLSEGILQDDVLARLITFPNVIVTAHQAFLTHEALHNIAETTLKNIQEFAGNRTLTNQVKFEF